MQPERRAEDPFAAANGTLHFASERKTAAQANRAGSTPTRAASAGTRSTTGTTKSTSGGSKQPPKKRRRKKKNKRLILFAFGFLLFAILVLVGVVLLLNYYACGGRERCQGEEPTETAAPGPEETPLPVTDATVITADATIAGVHVWNRSIEEARQLVSQ